jgi:TetR/AcrR family transcriptional regulator, transcriptional repressor of bet genes
MPRHADHDQRRREIAFAVWAITSRSGLDAVSLREVAREAGVSMGLVQHYFESKDEMVRYACAQMIEEANSGMEALLAASPRPASARAALRAIAQQSLADDPTSRAGAGVWHAFISRASIDGSIASQIREALIAGVRFVAEQLTTEIGAAGARNDAHVAAVAYMALVDGLVSRVIVGQITQRQAMSVVDRHLDELLGPTTRGRGRGSRTARSVDQATARRPVANPGTSTAH